LTPYTVIFRPRAKKAWDKLAHALRTQFARRLDERRRNPRIPSAALGRMPDCYKIKLRAAGYRLVYQVIDEKIVILVLAVGRRDRNEVYEQAAGELRGTNDRNRRRRRA
jgi:mRNA interferase RelE/StbE